MLLLRSVGDHADVTSLYPTDVKDEEDEKNELEFYNDQLVSQDTRLLDIEEDMSESDDDDITDEKITNEISFKSGHFNVDSSSDDDSISRGLNFNNVCTTDSTGTTQKPQQQPITSILQNISLVPLLLEKIKNTTLPDNVKEQGDMKKTSQEKRRLLASDSEEDSDFEFLNVDEMEDL